MRASCADQETCLHEMTAVQGCACCKRKRSKSVDVANGKNPGYDKYMATAGIVPRCSTGRITLAWRSLLQWELKEIT